MMPSYDPATLYALVETKANDLEMQPLTVMLRGPMRTLRVGTKSALKRWRRAFEFHKSQSRNGRKETPHGNCNS